MISAPNLRARSTTESKSSTWNHSKTPCPGSAASALTRLGWSFAVAVSWKRVCSKQFGVSPATCPNIAHRYEGLSRDG